jgi:hypothetical protein
MSDSEEKSLTEELADEPVTDTSTKRSRFSAFTLFFVVMVLGGLVIAAVMLYSGSKAIPAIQESGNSNAR